MKLQKRILDAFMPQNCTCYLCGTESIIGEDHLCSNCRSFLIPCGSLPSIAPLDGLYAALQYDNTVRGGIHALKYDNDLYYADFFAAYMKLPKAWEYDCIVPVPLHPLKQFLRGYNQSLELCRALQQQKKCASVPLLTNLVHRARYTKTQTKKTAEARRKNMKDAFCASRCVQGKSILLVDDVVTTGATLASIASCLKAAGAKAVYAACVCSAMHQASGSSSL